MDYCSERIERNEYKIIRFVTSSNFNKRVKIHGKSIQGFSPHGGEN